MCRMSENRSIETQKWGFMSHYGPIPPITTFYTSGENTEVGIGFGRSDSANRAGQMLDRVVSDRRSDERLE